MNIYLILKQDKQKADENHEDIIKILYDYSSNPFNVGDIVSLSVSVDLPHRKLLEYSSIPKYQEELVNDNKELFSKYNLVDVEIYKISKYLKFNVLESHIDVDCYCKIIKNE